MSHENVARDAERRRGARRGPLRPVPDAMYRTIRWVGGHVRGFYAAVGLFLLIGLATASLSLLLFLGIARWVAGGMVQSMDVSVLTWLHRNGTAWMDVLALVGTALGSGVATYAVLVVGSVGLWITRHHLSAVLLVISLLGGRVLIGLLKGFYDRPRPALFGDQIRVLGMTFDYPESASFPSGHAITAVVIFGTLAYLVARVERTRHLRRVTLATALLLILLIGFSRIYLGVHYPSDVVAGMLAGLIWATFCVFTIELVRYFWPRKPEVRREEADLEEGLRPLREALRPEERRA